MINKFFFLLFFWQAKVPLEPRGIFYLDAPSASICLLIQLEKPATEEGGVTPSVYSRKEPVFTWTSITFFPFFFSSWIQYFISLLLSVIQNACDPPNHFFMLDWIPFTWRNQCFYMYYMSFYGFFDAWSQFGSQGDQLLFKAAL